MSDSEIERNKDVVKKWFAMIYGDGSNLALIDELIAEDYVQHNPEAGQGREGVRRFFTEVLPIPLPPYLDASGIQTEDYIGEGEFVVRMENRTNGLLIDVFRLRDGQMVEHWDAFRTAPGHQPPPSF